MKILAINGSPRGKKGNTFIMVESFLAGAKAAGAETEHVLLAERQIEPCKGCFSCWLKTPGKCVIKDDMTEMLEKIKTKPDIVVFATPLYVFNVTGLMKNFMDRTVPLADPHFDKDESGLCSHASKNSYGPKLVVISNCGFPEQEHFKALHGFFEIYAQQSHGKLLAEIYRGQGGILNNDSLLLRPFISHYKKLLETAGSEIVKNEKLSDDLIAKLNKPLVPIDMYIKEANKNFDKALAKLAEKKTDE
jgi:multimeric flavodoxin WrbA